MIDVREMTISDYDQAYRLWSEIEGLALSEADSRSSIDSYLKRNAGLSYIAETNGKVIGTILAGHDGRRGFIYHLAVDPDFRKRKLGLKLVSKSLQSLAEQGIDKCHIFVIDNNFTGNLFWSAAGWKKRSGFFVYSKDTRSGDGI